MSWACSFLRVAPFGVIRLSLSSLCFKNSHFSTNSSPCGRLVFFGVVFAEGTLMGVLLQKVTPKLFAYLFEALAVSGALCSS